MGTIFVAYGDRNTRETVLEFAAERAVRSGDDLFVYHVQEGVDEDTEAVQSEIDAVIDRVGNGVEYTVEFDSVGTPSDENNISIQKRLLDAITADDRDYEYVVMGNVEHGMLESLSIPSATEAVLTSRSVPVLLVPVED